MVRLRSCAALVVFQACVSGVGEHSIGNDVLGLAHSILSSGVGAFIGALWNVSDKASALLMSFLFRELTTAAMATHGPMSHALGSMPTLSIADCLRRAQVRLYQTDAGTAKAAFKDFRDACVTLDPAHISPRHRGKIIGTLDEVILVEQEGFYYRHPFFWAPFVLVGHGAQHLDISYSQDI
jgi:CHAT domain-containing protein